jgi:uncharacterized membrane protein
MSCSHIVCLFVCPLKTYFWLSLWYLQTFYFPTKTSPKKSTVLVHLDKILISHQPMLKLQANYGFHELFLNKKVIYQIWCARLVSGITFIKIRCVICSSSIYGFWLPPFDIFKLFLKKDKIQSPKEKILTTLTPQWAAVILFVCLMVFNATFKRVQFLFTEIKS